MKLKENKLLYTPEKIQQVVKLMVKHWRVLDSTKNAMRIGKIQNIKHNILLKEGAVLSHQKPMPLNPIIRQQVENQLKKWETQNVIKKADGFSRHTSPLVPVLKKDGISTRPAADFRKLNNRSVAVVGA